MPLVGVEHRRCRGPGDPAVGTQGAHSPDAQQHFLLQSILSAAAVKTIGHIAFGGSVLLDTRVE